MSPRRRADEEPAVGVAGWVVATAIAGTVLIAFGAFWLSFTALTDLAVSAGVPVGQAWVWPLIVDGILIVATISVVALAPHGRRATWYPWTLLVCGALVSLGGNALHATLAAASTVSSVLAAAVASVPPLVLLAITHLTVELTSRTARPTPRPTSSRPLRRAPSLGAPEVEAMPASAERLARGEHQREESAGDRRARAVGLRSKGMNNRQIADELGVHPSTVGRWLAK